MKNLYILMVSMTVLSINLFAQQPPVSEFLEKVPLGIDNPPDTLPEFLVTFDGSGAPDDLDGYRMVYWVHGLNGDESSLKKPGVASEGLEFVIIPDFPARKLFSAFPEYSNSQSDLDVARHKLNGELELDGRLPANHNKRNDFIISHSQGGIVSRALDRHYSFPENQANKKFGGIITLATSNQGAQVINNQDQVKGVFTDIVQSLSAGPIQELQAGITPALFPFLYRFVGNSVLWLDFPLLVAANASNYAISESFPGITSSYAVNATALQLLNTYTPDNTDLVAFYAVRDDLVMSNGVAYSIPIPNQQHFPNGFNLTAKLQEWGLNIIGENIYVTLSELPVPISWATIEYFLNDPSEDLEFFKSHEREHELALDAHKTKFKYQAKRMAYNATAGEHLTRRNGFGVFSFHPVAAYLAWVHHNENYIMHKDIREAYREGVEFFDRFDQMHRVFIGARVTQAETINEDKCLCTCSNYGIVEDVTDFVNYQGISCQSAATHATTVNNDVPGTNFTCNIVNSTTTTIQWINKPSDGVVLAESAMNIPQATWAPQPILGSTHMAIRNDENLKYALLDIFEGEVGLFFETEEK